ncbi:CPBP family intramembrane metalloprotease [Bacillus velezensis]|nr:CPBP family intramembrane metalloprotease [Bacillus sp. EKM420B]KAF6605822.1 CPBP family intramembrane metalloprotease [Bacillus sp. EKM417B]POI17662.1 CPBP family intramembrane metalloprotease [Bacillus velezensis]QZY42255.1 CPBP family intramembrane metalloprotease [Bacillus velezensis]
MMELRVCIFIGILIHLMGPYVSKLTVMYQIKHRTREYKLTRHITPQRSYDIVTIVGGIICFSIFFLDGNYFLIHSNNPYGVLLFSALGFFFPYVIWKRKNKSVVFVKRKVNKLDTLMFLPLCAVSEELIWRIYIPFLFELHFFDSVLLCTFISSIGFLLLHIPLGGVKSAPYMTVFTVIAVIAAHFDFLSAAVFHIVHNLTIQYFRPVSKKKINTSSPTMSQAEW